MEKEFVPYTESLALKELGFDEPCLAYWNFYTRELNYNGQPSIFSNEDVIQLPTFSQCFRWFREKKYQAEILWRGDVGDFCWKIGRFKYGSHFFSLDGFKTYEEAELECVKKLIEIVKLKI